MEKPDLSREVQLEAKIRQYEPMIHAVMNKLNILYDKDDFLQIGRIAVFQALLGYDPARARGATESQFVYTRIYQRLIDEIRRCVRVSKGLELTEWLEDDGTSAVRESYVDLLNGDLVELLTEREMQWLELMTEGYSTSEIAGILGVSISTIKAVRLKVRVKVKEFVNTI
ncbi:sigma-70 family RNA polymerase sigma factor [Lacicoccus alkaliphilus]|uniref:RNA polymerase sigma factor, sigma-70 family n=1 Tax=Lacicoccus alkaliphilus DSM 16010 TaxID=1123231 RepID=A0A1M7G2D5_9BACL|nr:sigma-70 family RNA polymerase sigma factor [Salinicoccus alkaliphilus]SHM10514.1 RNA polymerase sigma factor, sigma-70 family [Salinicoccus alkaliphilus DSM 16010]